MTRQQPEKAEQAAIVQLLESLGAKVYVLGTRRPKGDYQGTRQTPGIPDLYAFMPPRGHCRLWAPVWIEVKAIGGKLNKAQEAFRNQCDFRVAAHHYVTGTCDDVQNWLVDNGWLKASQRRTG